MDEYLKNKCVSRVDAIRAIDPTIKNPKSYAHKLFREPDFQEELSKRRKELLKASAIDVEIVVKALSKELYGSLGLIDRTVLAHGKNGFDTIVGRYSDSSDAKNYWGIIKDILGGEVSTIVSSEDIKISKEFMLKEAMYKLSKDKLAVDKKRMTQKDEKKSEKLEEFDIIKVRKYGI